MKEMVGGCCVCSDERGWPENPLVYCDGQNCTVAVHQACYGIVTVPTGPWYCRKCESNERSTRVRCELCPSRDGALKKTDSQGWAHVVCALYIPEVRFGNVTTMEPIILSLIPQERYSKSCYICHDIGKPNRANAGACMQCNKSGCKQQFHVTCAQALGLLCEEAGNYLDNVKYCGYCQHHYSKLKKGGNVKTIPPYKPITHDTSGSDSGSSPEKEIETTTVMASASSTSATTIKITTTQNVSSSQSTPGMASSSKQRKSSTASKQSNVMSSGASSASTSMPNSSNTISSGVGGNSSGTGASASSLSGKTSSSSNNKEKDKHSKSLNKITGASKDKEKDASSSSTATAREKNSKSKNKDLNEHHTGTGTTNSSSTQQSNVANSTPGSNKERERENSGQKFTTSNFTDSPVIASESVFGLSNANDNITSSSRASSGSSSSSSMKKRKADSGKSALESSEINNSFRDIIKDVSVTLIPLPMDRADGGEVGEKISKKPKTEISATSPRQVVEPNIQNVSPNLMQNASLKQQQTAATSSSPQIITATIATASSSPSNSTNGSTGSTGVKMSAVKDQDDRLHSNSPYTTAASTSGNSTPSLYVSVPLSTANVPGINLPTTTAASTTVPDNPISRSNSNSQLTSIAERQSPRLHQNQVNSTMLVDQHSSNSLLQSSNAGSVIQQNRTSPSPSSMGASSGLTGLSADSGGLKISYEIQNSRVAQLQEQESAPGRRSRTPDSGLSSQTVSYNTSSSTGGGGLKFIYESQIGATPTIAIPPISTTPPTIDTNLAAVVKESPQSSPGSEAGSARKRGRKSADTSDVKVYQNGGGIHASHMLGNQLNPASSASQKLNDQLRMEIQDHSVFQSQDIVPSLVGVPFPSRTTNSRPVPSQNSGGTSSLASMFGNGLSQPTTLEELLERHWEQGSQFLMEQAQHFDIASLLSCLHELRSENGRLEEHVNSLIARRDHLLAVNARLAIPLTSNLPQNPAALNNLHLNGPTTVDGPTSATAAHAVPPAVSNARVPRSNTQHFNPQQQQPQSQQQAPPQPIIENGVDFRHASHSHQSAGHPPTPSSGIRHSSVHSNYSSSSSSTPHSNHHSVMSSTTSAAASHSSRHQQQSHHQPQHHSQSHHHHHHQQHVLQISASEQQQHLSIRGSRVSGSTSGGGGVSSVGSSNALNIVGGLIHSGTGARGGLGDGPASAYHSAYNTVHQSQLRRDDVQGKPS